MRNDNLIFDIGTSEGNDTDFYLRKGFSVLALEADPVTYQGVCERFEPEIIAKRLKLYNAAAAMASGERLEFWRNDKDQGLSSLARSRKARYSDTQTRYEVVSMNWNDLISTMGIPYYAKIDIEGGEIDFLGGIADISKAPRFISAEAKTRSVLDELYRIGYRKFKIIDQKATRIFKAPNPPLEGLFVNSNNSNHGSGLFGRELPGNIWLDYETTGTCLESLLMLVREGTIMPTWFDCHATTA